MTAPFRLTLAQINPVMGDMERNREKIISAWEKSEAELVVFPEMVLCGYPPEDLVLKPLFILRVEEAVRDLCDASRNFSAAAIVTCPWIIDGKTYNALHVIENGRIIYTQAKCNLPNYSVFDEKRVFAAAQPPAPFIFRGRTLGLMICEDMWSPEIPARLKEGGAEILIVINGSPYEITKNRTRLNLARTRTAETGLPIVYVNLVGGQDELVFDGTSFVIDAGGRITEQLPSFEECVIETAVSSHPGTSKTLKDADPPSQTTPENDYKSLHGALCLGLKDYIKKNGFPGVVLGLSGGIDSALTAVIAADSLGPENVHCVMMPSRFTSQDSLEDAAALVENLGCTYETISIEEPLKSLESIMNLRGTAHENSQSRLRGLILMALSNDSGKMVLSTGNKSELAVGYATIYGDMNGGFNVLKDLYKTRVFDLARWRNTQAPIIPENILSKEPSAELRENQIDRDSLPPYDVLDDILECLVENEMNPDAIVERGHDLKTVLKVWRMLDRAEHKRHQAPPGIKVTSRAFGRDRRYPITSGFMKLIEKQH